MICMESKQQERLVKWLREQGAFVLLINGATQMGIPDVYALYEGVSLFIEVKQPNKTPTKLQEEMIKLLNSKGAIAYVEDDINFSKTRKVIRDIYGIV